MAILPALVAGLALSGEGVPLWAGVALIGAFGLGLTADVIGLPTWAELLGQIVLALLLVGGKLFVSGVVGPPPVLWLVTVVLFVGVVNAVGLADGVDGEAAGLVSLAAFGLAVLSARFAGPEMFALVLAGAALGFLGVNAPPAAIFLGANGTMLTGAGLGVLIISIGRTVPLLLAALMCLGVLAVELLLALIRRALGKHKGAGGDHLSDQLIARGMRPRSVLGVTYLLQIVFLALAAVMGQLFSGQAVVIFGAVWVMVIVMLFAGGFVSYRVDV